LETGPVTLELSNAEALVLLDFLARGSQRDLKEYAIEYQAEQRVLWDLEAVLEGKLTEVVNQRYREQVALARAEVQDDPTGGG
jgi:hypothetical protein